MDTTHEHAHAPIRVVILANRSKPQVVRALEELRPWLHERARIVAEPGQDHALGHNRLDLPEADVAIVLGGDGTLLSHARSVALRDLPVLGVNFGKVGFLAEFSLHQLRRHWDQIASGKCRMSRRLMIEVLTLASEVCEYDLDLPSRPECLSVTAALNDAVITAGPPFRMIELELTINPSVHPTATASCIGDGMIVSTASGSTAYNLSAGGPIVSASTDALCITPICPHSLAFRPIVIGSDDTVCLRVKRANPGTHLVIDGQSARPLESGQQVYVRRHAKPLRLIHNPELNYWQMLARKMHWAAKPSR